MMADVKWCERFSAAAQQGDQSSWLHESRTVRVEQGAKMCECKSNHNDFARFPRTYPQPGLSLWAGGSPISSNPRENERVRQKKERVKRRNVVFLLLYWLYSQPVALIRTRFEQSRHVVSPRDDVRNVVSPRDGRLDKD